MASDSVVSDTARANMRSTARAAAQFEKNVGFELSYFKAGGKVVGLVLCEP